VAGLCLPLVAQDAAPSPALPRSEDKAQRISPTIAAAVVAGLSSFNPPAPLSESPKSAEEGVVQLPQVMVYAPKLVLPETEVTGKWGLEQLLRSRYPGASFKGQDPDQSMLPNYAALMYRDDKRLAAMEEFGRLVDALKAMGQVSGSSELLQDMQRTFLRRPTWREEAMDRSYNGNRR
jgi:hypothetical protein